MNKDPGTAALFVLTVGVSAAEAEAAVDWIRDAFGKEPVLVQRPGTTESWIEVYFDSEVEALLAAEINPPGLEVTRSVRRCEQQDWATFWRHHFRRTPVGKRLLVAPSWDRGEGAGERIEVVLDPGLSFGTGDHFTTRFCLEMLDELANDKPGSMLDVGTGSGILSVAAAKLGFQPVVALDHDRQSLHHARANLVLNGVEDLVTLREADVREGLAVDRSDVVCANLYGSLLIEIAPALKRVTNGRLVLAGILEREADGVADAYVGLGGRETVRDGDGEWCGLLFEFSLPS